MQESHEDADQVEREELITHVLDLQSQLRALITRVDEAKTEHRSLVNENQLLQKYINNSLTSTAVFGATGNVTPGAAAAAAAAVASPAHNTSENKVAADHRP